MNKIENYILLEIGLKGNCITSIFDVNTKKYLKSFFNPLTKNGYKLYVIKNNTDFLYIGITPLISKKSRGHKNITAKKSYFFTTMFFEKLITLYSFAKNIVRFTIASQTPFRAFHLKK